MTKTLSVAAFALLATLAVGQYSMKNVQYGTQDLTAQTNTVNAWKYFAGNPVCLPNTIAYGYLDSSVWCIGTDHKPYIFNFDAKVWNPQPQMGTGPDYLIVINQGNPNIWTNVYSLQPTSTCNTYGAGWYDLFHWNPNNNTWTQPHAGSCITMGSADYKGNLYVVGWDSNAHVKALFTSTDGGSSYSLLADGYSFINMQDDTVGCALDNSQAIWLIRPTKSAIGEPALPYGTAAGCIQTETPSVLMAWNTSGQAYILPPGTASTSWQPVTGINLQSAIGTMGYFIYGEDSAGKIYHWNVNALGASANYGGQWNSQNGCPSPGHICNPNTTHTVNGHIYFTSGHGVGGVKQSSTQTYTNDIETYPWAYNPLCDPFVGLSGDTECQMVVEGDAMCNQSHQAVGNDSSSNGWGLAIDVEKFRHPISAIPPEDVGTMTGGTWITDVTGATESACSLVGIGLSATCTVGVVDMSFQCKYKNMFDYGSCLELTTAKYNGYLAGAPSPWIFKVPYIIDSYGRPSCLPFTIPGEPRNGNWVGLPGCQ